MKYCTYAFYLNSIAWDLDSEEKCTYYLRRGNANALLGIASDAAVDQVINVISARTILELSIINTKFNLIP